MKTFKHRNRLMQFYFQLLCKVEVLVVVIIMFFTTSAYALTVRTWDGGAGTSDFNTAANWSDNVLPSATDSCIISVSANKVVSLSASITVGALSILVSGNNVYLQVSAVSYTLTIEGNFHSTGTSGNSGTYSLFNVGTGSVIIGRHAFFDNGGTELAYIYGDATNPGTFTFKGNLTMGSNSASSTGNEPDMLFDGTGSQILTSNGTSYFRGRNITIGSVNNPSITFAGSQTGPFTSYDGNVTINGSSILDLGTHTMDRSNAGGTFTISSGSTLKIAGTGDFPANYTTKTLAATSNVYYNGTTQSVTALTYGNVYLQTSGTKTSAGTNIIAGALTVASGVTFAVATTSVTVTGTTTIPGTATISTGTLDANGAFDATGGAVTFTGAGNLNLGGAVTSLGTFTESTSTVAYDYAGAQTVDDDAYYNLTFTSAGTKTSAGTTTVGNTLTINTDAIYDVSATSVTVTGTSTIPGTLTIGTGTFDANGTFNATGGAVTITGSGNLILGSTVTALGTFSAGTSTVTYDGVTQNVAGVDYHSLTIDGSGTKTLTGTMNLGGSNGEGLLTVDTGCTLALGDQTITHTYLDDLGTDNNTISGTVTLNNGTWTPTYGEDCNLTTTGSITITGTGTVNLRGGGGHTLGTFTAGSGTVYYNRNGDQSINAQTFKNLIIDGTGTKTLAGSVDVNGNLTIASGLTLAIESYTINLTGNFTNEGTTTATSGNVIFDGGAAQTISGAGTTTFHDLSIANTSGDVALSINATVTGTLTMTTGDLVIATTKKLSITDIDDPGISGGSATTMVVTSGTASVEKTYTSTTKITFPMGDGTKYRPIALTPSGIGSTVWTVGYTPDPFTDFDIQPATGLDHVSYQEYWSCVRTGGSPENAIVELTWISTSDVSDYTLLEIAHYDGTTDWDMIAATPVGDNTSGTLTSGAAVSTFSPFTIGTTSAINVLPIKLASFRGKQAGKNNELNWTTASEINNDYFTVEKTLDGNNFETIGTVKGAGNSNQFLTYSMVDYDVRNVLNYYRLKQTDFDGKYDFSEIIAIDNSTNKTSKEIALITNILGQEVNEYYRGIVIIVYSDGTSIKVIQ